MRMALAYGARSRRLENMNPTKDPGRPQQARQPLSEAAKASLPKTHTLFRLFIVSVLGAFFVYQLDVTYLWLTAILTAASIALGIVVLVRAVEATRNPSWCCSGPSRGWWFQR